MTIPRVRRIIQSVAENKFIDLVLAPAAMPTTWTFASVIFPIVLGQNASQRIGNKIFVKSIQFSWRMSPLAPQPNAGGCIMRMIVYHNKECRGSLITVADLFASTDIGALRSTTKQPACSILKDITSTGVSTGGGTTSGPQTLTMFSVKVNKRIDFVGSTLTTGAIADLLKDDYGFGMICDVAAACNMQGNIKVIYTDL